MPYPFSAMPTLGQFIERAVEQGCREKRIVGLIGPHGEVDARYIVGLGRKPAIAVLPKMEDTDHLTPAMIAHFVRVLKISGFEHCYIDEMKTCGYIVSDEEET